MLASLTYIVNLVSMASTLWMALYLFARGFPNRIAMRACLALLALSIFFLGTYNNFFVQTANSGKLRAVLLVIGFACWYSVTIQLLSKQKRMKIRRAEIGVYVLCAVSATALLITKSDFTREQNNNLYVAYMENGLVFSFYGFTQIATSVGSLYNLLAEKRVQYIREWKYFLLASIFQALAFGYGALAYLLRNPPMPRVIEDTLVFSGVFLLGISVARHQSLLERHTILSDFPITGLAMAGIASASIFISVEYGVSASLFGDIAASVIIAVSLYDLCREALERLRIRDEIFLRKRLFSIENKNADNEKLQDILQEGLDLLLATLNASAGLIAVRREKKIVVIAARNSAEVESEIPADLASHSDISRSDGQIFNIEWTSSAYEGRKQIALVGIGASNMKLDYSTGDLELFAEFANHVGTIVSIGNLQPQTHDQLRQLAAESKTLAVEMNSVADEMLELLLSNPKAEFIKIVEEGLRRYSDWVRLGSSPLADHLSVAGSSQIERGRRLQRILREAIESLRPDGARPAESLPRTWYNYVVLYDAYVKGILNREIRTRLYISEGTFNRTRRNAVRGIARWLIERSKKNLDA